MRGERKRKGKEDCKGEMMNGKSKGGQEEEGREGEEVIGKNQEVC